MSANASDRDPRDAVREHSSVLGRDVRYALRMMRRTPGFTALAVLMLALGTGATVAMFSVIDAVMLRSPFPDPDRLAVVQVAQDDGRFTSRMTKERFAALAAFRQGMALGVAGIATGCLVAAGVTRYLEGWIYGVAPLDRLTFAAAAAFMFLIAACAIYVPMRKAISVDPAAALRAE